MADNQNSIFLKGGRYYITERETDAFRIKSGQVLIFIVPLKNGRLRRRSFLYEATQGEAFPSFYCRDEEFCEWRFCLVAKDEAEIEIIINGSTKILRKRFTEKVHIDNFEIEGFNGSIIDRYKTNIVTEDGFIRRTESERQQSSVGVLALIANSFRKRRLSGDYSATGNLAYDAANLLCIFTKTKIATIEKVKEACGEHFSISDIARVSNFAYREILLDSDWYKSDIGPFIAYIDNDKPVVCLPKSSCKYEIIDVTTGERFNAKYDLLKEIKPKAYMFYRPLPSSAVSRKEIIRYCLNDIRISDVVWLSLLSIITALVGIITPTISQSLYDTYIPIGARNVLFQLGAFALSFMIANIMFSIVKNLVNLRITSRMSYDMQSAIYARLFTLPESFFRKFESADLAQRAMYTASIVSTIASCIITSILSLVYIVIYFVRMLPYSSLLSFVGLLMVGIVSVVYYLLAIKGLKYKASAAELDGKTESVMYQFLNGISKIRMAGMEERAIYEYFKPYVRLREYEEKANKLCGVQSVLSLTASSVFSCVLYVIIIKGNLEISYGAFAAFNSLFGAFAAYAIQIVENLVSYKNTVPFAERLKPILSESPETDESKEMPGELTGNIEINNVSFSYDEDAPLVLDGINLTIKQGEYVAIVGPSGCGKSTLLKLLLGFEKPKTGKIYYDNKDIESVNKRELRKRIGVVLQSGSLISGSIYENITLTKPGTTAKEVNDVIKAVGLEEDISNMPMGLHTVLSENCGTISGGQQQRILIARAIVSKPNILYFDEATSALDNVTQSLVCSTLEKLKSTRVVIAHRLSTIISCDRIIVMDGGKIVEEGNYQQLMDNKGLFYQLASRQLA